VVIDDDALNSCAFGSDPRGGVLATTRGLLESLDRLQLEGVLARQLAVLANPQRPAATVAVSLGRFVPGGLGEALMRRVVGAEHLVREDFDAVRFTRYPPGLASALETMAQGSTAVAHVNRRARDLWIVDPTGGAEKLEWPVGVRVDALREL